MLINSKKLFLFTVEVYLEDNDNVTTFVTFAKSSKSAEMYVQDYIQHYITDNFTIANILLSEIKEGNVINQDGWDY